MINGLSLEAQQINQEENIFQRMTINLVHPDQEIERIELNDIEVEQFKVAQFLEENAINGKIQLRGTIMSEHVVTKMRFDSKDLTENSDCPSFCRKVQKIEQIPFLGVATQNEDAFEGISINKIIDNTAAEDAGLQIGDIITHVDEEEIRSGCDLRSLISTYEVGQNVEVQFIRNQRTARVQTALGFRLVKEVSWVNCCNMPTLDLAATNNIHNTTLDLFPNPNNGLAQMHYTSSQKGPLKISVTDVSGRIIYQKEIINFDGVHQEYLNLTGQAEGIYFVHLVQADQIQTKKMVVQKEY